MLKILKRMRKDLSDLCVPKSEIPNFKPLVTLPNNNAEVGTRVSATYSSHLTRPGKVKEVDARGISHNRQRPDGTIWSIQPKWTPLYEILQTTRVGKQYTYMLGALYVTRSITAVEKKNLASFNRATQILQAQATYRNGCLLDCASCGQSDQFSSSCQERA